MKLKYIIIILLLCTCPLAKAQIVVKLYEDTTYIHRLQERYTIDGNDSTKAYLAFQLAYAYRRAKDIPKAKEYLEKGISLSGDNSFLKGASYYYSAYILLGGADLLKIKNFVLQADSMLSMYDHDEAYRLKSHNWILRGYLEQLNGNEKNGLDAYINHALPLAKKSKDPFTIANANKFVGISLLNAKEREKANGYLYDALIHFEETIEDNKALREESIVEVLLILAENNIYMNELEEGKSYLDRASAILKKYPSSNAFLFYYLPEGMYYEQKKQFQQAIQSYNKGIALQAGIGENYYINRAKYAKFDVLKNLGRNSEAIAVMQDLLKSNILFIHDRNSYYNLLAETYAST